MKNLSGLRFEPKASQIRSRSATHSSRKGIRDYELDCPNILVRNLKTRDVMALLPRLGRQGLVCVPYDGEFCADSKAGGARFESRPGHWLF
jgi:hypothetical protein